MLTFSIPGIDTVIDYSSVVGWSDIFWTWLSVGLKRFFFHTSLDTYRDLMFNEYGLISFKSMQKNGFDILINKTYFQSLVIFSYEWGYIFISVKKMRYIRKRVTFWKKTKCLWILASCTLICQRYIFTLSLNHTLM